MKRYLFEYTVNYVWRHKYIVAESPLDAKRKLPKRARNVRVWLTKNV